MHSPHLLLSKHRTAQSTRLSIKRHATNGKIADFGFRIADCFPEWSRFLDREIFFNIKKAIIIYILKIEPEVNPQFAIRNPQLLVALLNFKESQLLGFVIWMGVIRATGQRY